ncbi:kinase-like domain-containing protein [Rhizophagus clarus]|uniref:Kinase-like domain-containing protein n=1 Tax=Rhizophagus clarus TaxID=94130 RepID=A0A8H3L2K3_9GLOM|nr:kinase-like domain-containing protein [Rhizophagus clarus]
MDYMTITETIKDSIDVAKGLNNIKSSNLTFAKEALQITAQAGEAITPFIPLIGLAATTIVEIVKIYQTSQYNKRICNSLLDRARLSEIAIDQLIRRRKENEKNFKNQAWYNAFDRFVSILGKIKTFAEKVSQLQGFKIYFKAKKVSDKFNTLMNEYDTAMKDLNFTIAIVTEHQQRIDHESLKADMREMNEFLEKIGDNIEENSVKMSLIYEEVQNIKSMVLKSEIYEAKRLDSSKLIEPTIGKENDTRGSRGKIKRKIYMNAIEVACKIIKIPDKDSVDYKVIHRFLAIYIKATQSPNIIQFYGLSTIDGATVMVLEWAELGSLRELYKTNMIPLKLKLSYALDICRGIAYLNALNIYHHDLKCSNIMVTEKHVAKLSNFNLSRDKDGISTSAGIQILENSRWLAPEKLKDNNYRYDHKCEIFSFGMLLWELTFEKKPYEDLNLEKIPNYVINGGREKFQFDQIGLASPDSLDAEIQKGFEKIIREAWNQDPDIRISITKLLIQLDDLATKSVKPGCPPGLQSQEIMSPISPLNDKNDEIPDDIDFDSIDIDEIFNPIIPISEGIKAHKEKNYEKAWKCFNEQAENQNSLGKYWKAYYLWEGFFDQKMDKLTALELYKEAADNGISDAQYRYACSLLDKNLKSKVKHNSKEEAVKYLRMAAENGSASAQFQMGENYSKGRLGCTQDLNIAKLWYKRAALQNDKRAEKKLKDLGVVDY